MINQVVITGKIVCVYDSCDVSTLAVIECNDEQYYILFNNENLPEPEKIVKKYVSIYGNLQNFKYKRLKKDEYSILTGIFVRRLEVYDI